MYLAKRFVLLAAFSFLLFAGTGCGKKIEVEETAPLERPAQIFVEKVDGIDDDFILGVDVSSALAEEKSGVVYYNEDGTRQDIMKTLAESGVTTVRIRVWNDPFDADGNSYGGGGNDLETAKELGIRATKYGLNVIIDFHYSDFWADPSKQMTPKAWQGMDINDKADALYKFTKDSMNELLNEGINIIMVQLGNETNGKLSGERQWNFIAKLMNAGAKAVRETAKKHKTSIMTAVHFANPENPEQYIKYADYLKQYSVDYDVFMSSYYPYWHGTLENLTSILTKISTDYGKKVMVGETSYAYTYEDGDNSGNSVSAESVCDFRYPVTVQGQATSVRDTAAAVTACGEAGIGVVYWEPAWIPVPGSSYEERSVLWEKYGSGWASSYAGSYDPNDAGKYYGGSSWDNQAMFDVTGHPLASLSVFRYLKEGASTDLRLDAINKPVVTVRLKDPVTLPETVQAIFNDGSTMEVPVTWDTSAIDLSNISFQGVATYLIPGTAESSGSAMQTVCQLDIVEKNYIENPGFELSDLSMWNITNVDNKTTELFVTEKVSDAASGTCSLHFYSTNNVEFIVEQTVSDLTAGTYNYSMTIHGGDAPTQEIVIYAIADGKTYEMPTSISSWREFKTPKIEGITTTDGTITIGIRVRCSSGAWGNLDDFLLAPVEE